MLKNKKQELKTPLIKGAIFDTENWSMWRMSLTSQQFVNLKINFRIRFCKRVNDIINYVITLENY